MDWFKELRYNLNYTKFVLMNLLYTVDTDMLLLIY